MYIHLREFITPMNESVNITTEQYMDFKIYVSSSANNTQQAYLVKVFYLHIIQQVCCNVVKVSYLLSTLQLLITGGQM